MIEMRRLAPSGLGALRGMHSRSTQRVPPAFGIVKASLGLRLRACSTSVRERLGVPRLAVQDASVSALTQMLTDTEEMPGPRLTFCTTWTNVGFDRIR